MATPTSQQSANRDVLTDNVVTAAVVGGAAYIVSYLMTYVFVTIDGTQAGSYAMWKAVGLVFYGAHFVQTALSGGGQSMSYNPLSDAQGTSNLTSTIPEFVYYLLPVIILLLAGYVAYQRAGVAHVASGTAAGIGASVAVGYLILGVVGRFLFTEGQAGASLGPELAMSIVLLGIVYPVVLGGIGGVLANQ